VLLMDTVPDGRPDDFADGQCVGTGLALEYRGHILIIYYFFPQPVNPFSKFSIYIDNF
jgi:hypothetical protein